MGAVLLLVALVLQVVAVAWTGLQQPLEVLLQVQVQVTQVELVVTNRLELTGQAVVVALVVLVLTIHLLMVVLVGQEQHKWEQVL